MFTLMELFKFFTKIFKRPNIRIAPGFSPAQTRQGNKECLLILKFLDE